MLKNKNESVTNSSERRRRDSNPWWGFCRPLPYHLATTPKKKSGRWDSNPRPSPWQGDVLPLYYARSSWLINSAESAETQDRTGDTAIFSRVLYQLSYLGDILFVKRPWFYTYLYGLSRKAHNSSLFNLCLNLLLDFLYPFRYNVRSLSQWGS